MSRKKIEEKEKRNETMESGKWETENVKGKTAWNMEDEKQRRNRET